MPCPPSNSPSSAAQGSSEGTSGLGSRSESMDVVGDCAERAGLAPRLPPLGRGATVSSTSSTCHACVCVDQSAQSWGAAREGQCSGVAQGAHPDRGARASHVPCGGVALTYCCHHICLQAHRLALPGLRCGAQACVGLMLDPASFLTWPSAIGLLTWLSPTRLQPHLHSPARCSYQCQSLGSPAAAAPQRCRCSRSARTILPGPARKPGEEAAPHRCGAQVWRAGVVGRGCRCRCGCGHVGAGAGIVVGQEAGRGVLAPLILHQCLMPFVCPCTLIKPNYQPPNR